jgi:hypothetical protein
VLGGDDFGVAQIGNGARHSQDAVVRAGGDAHFPHGHFESALAGVSAGIKRPQFRWFCCQTKPAIDEDAVHDSIPASKSPRLRIMPLQCDNRRYGHTPMSVL